MHPTPQHPLKHVAQCAPRCCFSTPERTILSRHILFNPHSRTHPQLTYSPTTDSKVAEVRPKTLSLKPELKVFLNDGDKEEDFR